MSWFLISYFIFMCVSLGALYIWSELKIYRNGGDVFNFIKKLDKFLKDEK